MKSLYENLSLPPAAKPDEMRVVALGGLGEVGRNMTVLETQGKLFIIDCGVLFPDEKQPGVDLILPDFSYIEDRLDDVEALVLTHGHEDHIGAVPYLLKLRSDIPVYGARFTLALLEPKLREHKIADPNLHVVQEGQKVQTGPFEMELVSVSHSIPDALAVFVRTDAGTVLATGDFKMDQLPIDGRLTDLRAMARLGEEGVDLFLVDSTNAEVPGFVTPEVEIGPVLDSVFQQTEGAVVVASFASHVHRVQQVLEAAYKTGRKVAFVGRSMERNMAIASELEFLEMPGDVVVTLKQLNALPEHQRVYMVTGSQGEPMAALARIASGTHPQISLGPGDTVVMASSLIPGNERSIYRVIDALTGLGARVVHQGNAKVHVSGHAAAGELIYLYNVVQPKNVMPVHGEVRHLIANGALAAKTGVPAENIVLAQDGLVIDMKDGVPKIVGAVPCELVFVDGSSVGEVSEEELAERMVLGSEGFLSAFATISKDTGELQGDPVVRAIGVAEDPSKLEEAVPELKKALQQAIAKGRSDDKQLEQVMRRVLGRFAGQGLRRRPVIVPVVTRL